MTDGAPYGELFSKHASDYAAFRPRYPDALFDVLASLAPGRSLAWDCATGNGQAASGLARHFTRVVATDASAAQVANATQLPNVEYSVATERNAPLPDESADLVTVAQAAHWLNLDAFYAECRRVLVRRGVVALWAYTLAVVSPEIDPLINGFYSEEMGPYWSPRRALVDSGYQGVPFPFEELPMPAMAIELRMTVARFLAYVRTWSSVQAYMRAHGRDPVDSLGARVAPLWGEGERLVKWPLRFRVGRVA